MTWPIWLRATLFIAILPGAVAGWIPWVVAGRAAPLSRTAAWVGIAMFVAGWSVLLWCTRDFVRRGRGSPSPYDPPTALVTTGLFRFSRNPMYVGIVVALIGFALWHWSRGAWLYAAFVALAFHLRVLLYEEPRLLATFGPSYENYKRTVPRWLGLRRRSDMSP